MPLLDDKAIPVIFANIEDILLTNTVRFSYLEELGFLNDTMNRRS